MAKLKAQFVIPVTDTPEAFDEIIRRETANLTEVFKEIGAGNCPDLYEDSERRPRRSFAGLAARRGSDARNILVRRVRRLEAFNPRCDITCRFQFPDPGVQAVDLVGGKCHQLAGLMPAFVVQVAATLTQGHRQGRFHYCLPAHEQSRT